MPATKTLRIVVFCLALETRKYLKAAEIYSADKAYMLYFAVDSPYTEYKEEVVRLFHERGPDLEPVDTNTSDFAPALSSLLKVINDPENEGHEFHVDISGPPAYSAAAMVACMMTNATPFFVRTKEYLDKNPEPFYKDGKPFGMSETFHDDPKEITTFPLKAPPEDIVRGLRVLKKQQEHTSKPTYLAMVNALDEDGLLYNMLDREGKEIKVRDDTDAKRIFPNVRQRAKMFYRRHFVDEWRDRGWITIHEGGRIKIEDDGQTAMKAFYLEE